MKATQNLFDGSSLAVVYTETGTKVTVKLCAPIKTFPWSYKVTHGEEVEGGWDSPSLGFPPVKAAK